MADILGTVGSSAGGMLGGALGTAFGPVGATVGRVAGSALGSSAGALLGALPNLIPTASEKENKKRIADLERRQALGTLGLTEAERQQLYFQSTAGIDKAAEDVRARQSGLAAALASGSGGALAERAAQQEAIATAKAAQERQVGAYQIAEKKSQEQELEDRRAIQSTINKERLAGIASAGLTGLGAIDEEIERLKTIAGSKPSKAQLDALSKQTGLSSEELGATLEFFASAPSEATELLKQIVSGGQAGAVKGGSGLYSGGLN